MRLSTLVAACSSLLFLVSCATPMPPETAPPRFALLTPEGILVVDANERSLVAETADVTSLCWAADGTGFLATTGTALVHVDIAGRRRTISDGWLAVRFPAVSRGGKRIAVSGRRRQGEAWGIWLIGRKTPRRLVNGIDPAWSADGRSIYFERYKPNQGLSVFDLQSGEASPFLDDGRRAYGVDCAPSGRLVVFTRGSRLVLYEPGKSSVRPVTDGRAKARFASISAGGRYVLYFRDDPSGQTHPDRAIVLHDLDTGTEALVPAPPNTTHPTFQR